MSWTIWDRVSPPARKSGDSSASAASGRDRSASTVVPGRYCAIFIPPIGFDVRATFLPKAEVHLLFIASLKVIRVYHMVI